MSILADYAMEKGDNYGQFSGGGYGGCVYCCNRGGKSGYDLDFLTIAGKID